MDDQGSWRRSRMPSPGLDRRRVRLERGDFAEDLLREFGFEAMGTHGVSGGGPKINMVDVSLLVLHG